MPHCTSLHSLLAVASALWLGACGAGRWLGSEPAPGVVYVVAGERVDLRDGEAVVPLAGVTGASARTHYRLLADRAGDLDADGVPDRAAVVAVDPGGSGTFIHVAATLDHEGGALPVGSVLLGDRVELQDLRILEPGHVDAGMIIVGLNIRDAEQPLAEKPRFYVTRMFRVREGKLLEIPQY